MMLFLCVYSAKPGFKTTRSINFKQKKKKVLIEKSLMERYSKFQLTN